ncbi:MAG: serine/threonine protein kinase [Myxococcales bacterium]|nr:serine/threonine protein kinase [Myxococcales bacterium]
MPAHGDLPASLGPYRLVRPIGHGGMAEVFLAVRYGASGFEKRVALKVLRREHRGRGDLERLIIAEARLGARFSHSGLVQVHDLGHDGEIYYLVMDYVDGADLARLTRSSERARTMPPALALHVGESVALALAHVHDLRDERGPLGLVHRDLSPKNILASRTGEIKLADFGIAKATALQDITWGRFMKGTFAYLSPEQAEGAAIGPRSDQFSLGVTLGELLVGRRPFDADGPLALLAVIRRAELPPDYLAGLPAELAALLSRMLSQRPGDRLPDLAAVARAVAEVRRGLPPAGPLELAAWVRAALDGDIDIDVDDDVPPTEHLE